MTIILCLHKKIILINCVSHCKQVVRVYLFQKKKCVKDASVIAPSAGQRHIRFDASSLPKVWLIYDLTSFKAWSWWCHLNTLTGRFRTFLEDEKSKNVSNFVPFSEKINHGNVSETPRGLCVHPIHVATHCPRYQQSMQSLQKKKTHPHPPPPLTYT